MMYNTLIQTLTTFQTRDAITEDELLMKSWGESFEIINQSFKKSLEQKALKDQRLGKQSSSFILKAQPTFDLHECNLNIKQ